VVEADGGVHSSIDQLEKDRWRDQNLSEMGFKVLRFPNEEILFKFAEVKIKILNMK
jgi:ATP-dependent DNA helicase RecG